MQLRVTRFTIEKHEGYEVNDFFCVEKRGILQASRTPARRGKRGERGGGACDRRGGWQDGLAAPWSCSGNGRAADTMRRDLTCSLHLMPQIRRCSSEN